MAMCPFCVGTGIRSRAFEGGSGLYECQQCGQFALAPGFRRDEVRNPSLRALALDWIFHENLCGRVPLVDESWRAQAERSQRSSSRRPEATERVKLH